MPIEATSSGTSQDAAPSPSSGPSSSPTLDSGDGSGDGSGDKLRRNISIRHMIFIALGGSIGAGLFVGSGAALSAGGPLSLVLNFSIVGFGVTCTMGSLGELAATFPVAGSFYEYSRRFVSEAWGFAMGWTFVLNWLIIFPFEITCIVSQVKFWGDRMLPAFIITPLLATLIATSFLGSRWYGELEHAFGIGKALALVIFIFMALCIIGGGVSSDPRQGTGISFWQDGLATRNGFPGFMLVFRVAGMSYGGTELLGMTAAECNNPKKALPLATKVTFFRILVFYILTLLLLGFVVPADDPRLASTGKGAQVSPFTLAAQIAGIRHLPTFFNVFIIVALVSMANASIFASSRAFQALCQHGMGPRWGATVKWGVPRWGIVLAFAFGTLAYVTVAPGGGAIFDWLLSLSGACNYYTWASICLSHIRFRRGWRAQGRGIGELLWSSPFGVWGSWVGLCTCVFALLANVIPAILPISGKHHAVDIVRDNIGPIMPWIWFLGYFFWSKRRGAQPQPQPLLVHPMEMDITSGVRLNEDVPFSGEMGIVGQPKNVPISQV
ncbi:amino acid permease [Sodiomyces alkalinus F11]|uniref:Amino acid permease n=1 Tax=Sodiomyces alkalinus (strain CBS 110278 / VKM F-3762 / F11) TaxID=1314773 RepID=A0A3N2Q322_SODAK|nr:amino acid permease [Sodiomyces alkalinus F11]ROT41127.1 amino acid permease [Sodiomyces alkalinus F11]